MDENRQLDEAKPTEEVTVGSVTVLVRYAPVAIRVKKKGLNGATPSTENGKTQFKTYDSYQIVYYEGKQRMLKRQQFSFWVHPAV